jgi:hypothetical protein
MIWYPSIGNEGYPYSPWYMKRWDFSWDVLELLEEYYEGMCSYLRRSFKWSPSEMDDMPLKRLLKIYDETVEEDERNRKNGSSSSDSFNY